MHSPANDGRGHIAPQANNAHTALKFVSLLAGALESKKARIKYNYFGKINHFHGIWNPNGGIAKYVVASTCISMNVLHHRFWVGDQRWWIWSRFVVDFNKLNDPLRVCHTDCDCSRSILSKSAITRYMYGMLREGFEDFGQHSTRLALFVVLYAHNTILYRQVYEYSLVRSAVSRRELFFIGYLRFSVMSSPEKPEPPEKLEPPEKAWAPQKSLKPPSPRNIAGYGTVRTQ